MALTCGFTFRSSLLASECFGSRVNHDRRARSLASQLQAVTGQRIVIRNGKAVIEPAAA